MFRSLLVTACIAFGAASAARAADNAPVAAMHKPVGTVECNTDGSWKKAIPAMPLYSGNLVRTQERSFAIIKFLESSILRVQENSEVEIRGTKTVDKEFSKNVHLRTGTVGFNVKHRANEKFEFSTPTSVASIRGTEGALVAESDSSDLLMLSSGTVVFTNNFSNRSVTVIGGQTGHSFRNGDINVRQSNPDDLNRLRHLQMLGSNEPAGSDSTGTHGAGGADSTRQRNDEVRIKLTDPDGNQKTLIIKYE